MLICLQERLKMPDSNTQTPTNPTPTVSPAPAADPSAPAVPTNVPEGPIADAMDRAMGKGNEDLPEVVSQVAGKIAESQYCSFFRSICR